MKTNTSAVYWPQHLREYTYQTGNVELTCFLDYEAPDRAVGWPGSAWLVHAYAGGVDVLSVLSSVVVREIEEEACSRFSE